MSKKKKRDLITDYIIGEEWKKRTKNGDFNMGNSYFFFVYKFKMISLNHLILKNERKTGKQKMKTFKQINPFDIFVFFFFLILRKQTFSTDTFSYYYYSCFID